MDISMSNNYIRSNNEMSPRIENMDYINAHSLEYWINISEIILLYLKLYSAFRRKLL